MRKDFDVIDHVKLLAFFEVVVVVRGSRKKEDFYVRSVPVRIERSPQRDAHFPWSANFYLVPQKVIFASFLKKSQKLGLQPKVSPRSPLMCLISRNARDSANFFKLILKRAHFSKKHFFGQLTMI